MPESPRNGMTRVTDVALREMPKLGHATRHFDTSDDRRVGALDPTNEAFSTGTPLVGLRETVADGVEGFLCRPGEVAVLADRIHRLLSDAGLREEFGRSARQRYEAEFTTTAFAQ